MSSRPGPPPHGAYLCMRDHEKEENKSVKSVMCWVVTGCGEGMGYLGRHSMMRIRGSGKAPEGREGARSRDTGARVGV